MMAKTSFQALFFTVRPTSGGIVTLHRSVSMRYRANDRQRRERKSSESLYQE
jgi:hypothetical protein